MIDTGSFEDACQQAEGTAKQWQAIDQGADTMFKRWSLRDLRSSVQEIGPAWFRD